VYRMFIQDLESMLRLFNNDYRQGES
jgi:hypothetical protein